MRGIRSAGLSVWWDADIAPQAPWETTIEGELAVARAVVVAWSGVSIASENVKAEARSARHDGRLVQVFLDACDPPLFFGERQGIDISRWSGAEDDPVFCDLVRAVQVVVRGETAATPPHAREARKSRIRIPLLALLLGGGMSVAGIVGVGVFANPNKSDHQTLAAIQGSWGRPGCPSPQLFSVTDTEITVRAEGWISTGRVVSISDGAVLSETLSPVEDRGRLLELRPEGDRMLLHDRTTDVRQVLERCP